MIADPILALQRAITDYLKETGADETILAPSLARDARWRPQVYDVAQHRGWHVLTEIPVGDSWKHRIATTQEIVPSLAVGLAGPEQVLATPEVLEAADERNAALLLAEQVDDGFRISERYANASEFVVKRQMQLDILLARRILDRGLQRAIEEPNDQKKGLLLETVAEVVFSQVSGFEVINRGISRESQQIDIAIHNRNVGGILGGSPMVLGEAKNWTKSVGPKEYVWLWKKMAATNGRAKLAFFITTDHFTKGVYTEATRDTASDGLIVLLDARSFPAIWREYPDITQGVEQIVIKALEDQRQRLMNED